MNTENNLKENWEKLRLSEERFLSLLDNSGDGIFIVSALGNIVNVTPSAEALFGFSESEIKKSPLVNLVHPADLKSYADFKENVLIRSDIPVKHETFRVRRRDGSWCWVDTKAINMLKDSAINGVVYIFKDVSHEKLADEKIRLLTQLYKFLSQINQAISHSTDEKKLLAKACNVAITIGKFDASRISRVNETSGHLEYVEKCGLDFTTIKFSTNVIDFDQAREQVLQTGRTYIHSSENHIPVNDANIPKDRPEHFSFIVLPLTKSETVVGTFTLYRSDLTYFSKEELSILEEAAGDLSYALNVLQRLEKKRIMVEALQRTESNLQAIVNSTDEGFILSDINGVVLEFNNNAIETFKLKANKVLSIGKELLDILPDNRLEDYKSYFAKVSLGQTVKYEVSYDDKWFSFTMSPVYHFDQITGFCISSKEITKAKLAEKKLIQSELFSKSVLSSLTSSIAVVNQEGTLIAVNKAWDDFAQANAAVELSNVSVGSNYFEVCRNSINHGDVDAKLTLDGIFSVLRRELPVFELEYPCHSPDEQRWFLLKVSPFGQDVSKIVITHQNITERKIAQNDLYKSSEDLQGAVLELNKILDNSLDIICTISADCKFVNISQASKDVLGYNPEELIGKDFIDLVYQEDIEPTNELIEKLPDGITPPVIENRFIHKSGKIVPLLWSINWDFNLQLMYCVAKDVSERKILEKAIENERDRFYDMFLQAPSAVGMLTGENHVFELANPLFFELLGKTDVYGKTVAELLPELAEQGFISVLDYVYHTGTPYADREVLVKLAREQNGELADVYINFVFQARRNSNGEAQGIFFFINDITEQVVAKKRLEKSERHFKGLIESSADMITMLDATGKTIYASPAVTKKFGYTADEVLELSLMDIVHPDDIDNIVEFTAEILRNPGVPLNVPLVREKLKDGSYIWVEGTMTNFLQTEGINAIVGNFRDITERRTADLNLTSALIELEAERTRLVTAQKVAKTGSWETNLQTMEVAWSNEMHQIHGTDPSEFKPSYTTIQTFIHTEDRNRVEQACIDSVVNNKGISIEHRIITMQGIEKCVEENWTISTDQKGVPLFAIGTCQDITERKKAADIVQKSEMKLKVAQQIAHVGSWEVDLSTDIHSWSDEFYRILEIDLDVSPSGEAFLSFVHPDDQAMAVSTMAEAFSIAKNSSYHFRFHRKDGQIGYASTEWRFDLDSSGKALYIYGILRDLTIEKKAEMERVKMIGEIIQRNKDLEQFSYIISHNLRSPVANIIGIIEELKDDAHDVETKNILSEALVSDANRLESVISDLNTILQTRREITERKETVILSELALNIELSIRSLIQKEGVVIKTNFSEIDTFSTIKSYMQSIFYNLISNSIKFGRAEIHPIIEISSHLTRNKLSLIFRDNGRGIDLTKKGSEIFGLYKRFHADTEGKGMGLHMVKTQVETLGGRISVKSEVNSGTEFTIEFDL